MVLGLSATSPSQTVGQPAATGADKFIASLDALVAQHQYARAEALVGQRLETGGDPAATNFQAGKVYFDHDVWQRSAVFLEKSLRLKPANDEAHELLGLAYRQLHRPADAEVELVDAAKEQPGNKIYAYFAGHQLLLNGKFDAALPYLYGALDSQVTQFQALQALALAQARLGNYGLAESYYRKAIDTPPPTGDNQYSALVNLSVLLLLGHDPTRLEEGLMFARRAEKLQPGSGDAHFLAGKALYKLGRLPEATPELVQAAKLNPADGKPHFLLAQIYAQRGRHDLARSERETFARIQAGAGQAGMAQADPLK